MKPDWKDTLSHASRGGVTLGHAWIRKSRVSYLEIPSSGGGRSHWVLCVADGVRSAIPLSVGPLVPGRPEASAPEILERLTKWVEGSHEGGPSRITVAVNQVVPHEKKGAEPAATSVFKTLRAWGWQGDTEIDRDMEGMFADWLLPLNVLLDTRLRLIDTFDFSLTAHRFPLPDLELLDRPAARDRILRLTHEETIGAASFMGGIRHGAAGLFDVAIRSPGVRLDRSAREIQAAVLECMGVAAAAARRVPADVRVTRSVARGMRLLPIDWIPGAEDADGWSALDVACEAMDVLTSGFPDAVPAWADLARGSGGDWRAFVDRCVRSMLGNGRRSRTQELLHVHVPKAAGDANDMVLALATTLGSPHGSNERVAGTVAYRAINGDRSLPAILENSREWHARFKAAAYGDVAWEPILPPWTDPESGIEIAPLASSEDLVGEARAMDHCVGGEAFALGSLRNEIRIVSLGRDGERLSTAEIALGPPRRSRPTLHGVVQHRARGNGPPCDEAVAALLSYMRLPAVDAARLDAEPNERTLPERTEAELEELMEAWRPFLTGPWRRASLTDFRDALAETIRAVGPGR